MATNYPNGLGAISGSVIATDAPFYTTGDVWYVHYGTGTDAASPRGQDDKKPLKTLRQALVNAASGDIIVLLDGHEEPIGAAAMFADTDSVTIVGAGTDSDGRPTAKFLFDHVDSQMIFDGSVTQIHNVWFGAAQADTAESRIRAENVSMLFRMVDCYIECGEHDLVPAMSVDSSDTTCIVWITGTTFVSSSTTEATIPAEAFSCGEAYGTMAALWMDDCTLDDGDYGFSDVRPFYVADPGFVAIENLTLAHGADIAVNSDNVPGFVNAQSVSGPGRVIFHSVGG